MKRCFHVHDLKLVTDCEVAHLGSFLQRWDIEFGIFEKDAFGFKQFESSGREKKDGRLGHTPPALSDEPGGFEFLQAFCRSRHFALEKQRRNMAQGHDSAFEERTEESEVAGLELNGVWF